MDRMQAFPRRSPIAGAPFSLSAAPAFKAVPVTPSRMSAP